MNNFSDEESNQWFDSCRSDQQFTTLQALLNRGFDPDTRRGNKSALELAANNSSNSSVRKNIDSLVSALQRKYIGDPNKLLKALTDGNPYGKLASDHNAQKQALQQAIATATYDSKILSAKNKESAVWFESCKTDNDSTIVREFLNQGFDPDARTASDKSGLVIAAAESPDRSTRKIIEQLVPALQRKYISDPNKLLKALTDGNPSGKLSSDHNAQRQMLQQAIATATYDSKMLSAKNKEAPVWFESCKTDNDSAIVREFLNQGFDPDIRTASDKSGLVIAATESQDRSTRKIIEQLIPSLQRKYISDPNKLLKALTDGNPVGKLASDHNAQKQTLQQAIANATYDSKILSAKNKEAPVWFESCKTDQDSSIVKEFLNQGFDPDARTATDKSGLVIAAAESHDRSTRKVIEQLIPALQRKYISDPNKLLKALTDGNPVGKLASDHNAQKQTLQQAIATATYDSKILSAKNKEAPVWFESCKTDQDSSIVKEFLNQGFDPDARTITDRSGLVIAAAESHDRSTRKVIEQLIPALQRKYISDPNKLLKALTDGNPAGKLASDHNAQKQMLQQAITTAQRDCGGVPAQPDPIVPLTTVKANTVVPIARSDAPSPLKLDNTITAARLLQAAASGKSNIEVLGEQGQLGDVFSTEIWSGRRKEMDEAWDSVPEKFRNQVNIEALRGKLSQAVHRDRFKIDKDTSWEQGF